MTKPVAMIVPCLILSAAILPPIDAAEYLVSDRATNRVLRYSADDGSFLGPLVDDDLATNGGLFAPAAMIYGFESDLYVTSIDLNTGDGQVLRYDPATGDFKGIFASGLVGPSGLYYHEPSDSMLVGSLGTGLGDSNVIARFSGDGTRLADIVAGPISGRTGMVAAADGGFLVSSFAEEPFFNGSVLHYGYDAQTDEFSYQGVFAEAPELAGANGLQYGPNGELFAASLIGQGVVQFTIDDNVVTGSSVLANAAYPSGLLLSPDGELLVTSLGNNNPNDPIYQDLFPGAVFKYDIANGAMIGMGPFLTGGDEFLPSAILLAGLAGDFDGNGQLTANDMDLLSDAVRQGDHPAAFDLDANGLVDEADRETWIFDLKNSYFGDSNLDGEFNTSDMILVLETGEYEDELQANSTWATGDWSGDREFDSADFITALQWEGYEQGPRVPMAAVPEPTTWYMFGGMLPWVFWRRWPGSRSA